MKDLFVPYELAVKLKEKGFEKPVLAFYDVDDATFSKPFTELENYNDSGSLVSAPLWQQVIDWLREDKGLNVFADCTHSGWYWGIEKTNGTSVLCQNIFEDQTDYYTALHSGIEKSLDLI
jgi:hypothetical protein